MISSIVLIFSAICAAGSIEKPTLDPKASATVQGEVLAAWRACDAGNVEGCVSLGRAYRSGGGVARDYKRAVALFDPACGRGNANACAWMGWLYATGDGVPKDYPQALRRARSSCDAGSGPGCGLWGWLHQQGYGVEKSDQKAVELFRRGCKLEKSSACTSLGYAYQHGKGVTTDLSQAAELYRQGCEGKSWNGCTNLGYLYVNAKGVTRSFPKAIEYYQRGCDGGDGRACSNLGLMHENAQGMTEDPSGAVKLYERACDLDYAPGCTYLGYMYESGRGVSQLAVGTDSPVDEVVNTVFRNHLAFTFYEKACKGDDARGCTNLGYMYANGLGVDASASSAAKYYKKGCDAGYARGCSNLGLLVQNGKGGLVASPREAMLLFRSACENDYKPGCENLLKLHKSARGLTPAEATASAKLVCDEGVADGCTFAQDLAKEIARKAYESRPLKFELESGVAGQLWIPAPVPHVEMAGRGYQTAYVRGRVSLFDRVDVRRFHYERTAGQAPEEGSGEELARDLDLPPVVGHLFEGLGTIRLTDETDKHILVMRYQRESYRIQAETERDLEVIDIVSGGSQFKSVQAGTAYSMPVRFGEGFGGYGWGETDDDEAFLVGIGASYLRHSKPWNPLGREADSMVISPMGAVGVGMLFEGFTSAMDGGWFAEHLMLSGEGQYRWGLGQTATKGTEAEDLFPEGTLFVSNSHISGKGRATLNFLEGRHGTMGAGIHLGFAVDSFNAETKSYLASVGLVTILNILLSGTGISASTSRPLSDYMTWDVRLQGGAEVRGSF